MHSFKRFLRDVAHAAVNIATIVTFCVSMAVDALLCGLMALGDRLGR